MARVALTDDTGALYGAPAEWLNNKYSAAVDRGQALTAKLDIGAGDAAVALLGDSTGNETTEWFYKTMQDVAAKHPKVRVDYTLWSDAAQAYGAIQTIQEGGIDTTPVTTRTLEDTFSRTVGDLKGTTLDTGQVWTGPYSNSTGKYSTDGSKATYNGTDGATGELIATGSETGGVQTARAVFTAPTTSTTHQTIRLFSKYVDVNNYLYVNGNVGTSSAFLLAKRIGGTVTTLASWSTSPITNNSASETFPVEITVDGSTVTATVNGSSVTATLTAADVTALEPAAGIGFMMGVTGASVDNVSLDITKAAPTTARTITDTFSRTVSDVKGTAPDVGGVWGGATNAGGMYSADGVRLTSTGAQGGLLISDGGERGDQTLSATFTIDTSATNNGKWVRLVGKYLSQDDYVFISGNIGGGWSVMKRISGTATTVASWASAPVPAAAGTTFGMTLKIEGTSVSATVNGNTITGSLTAADVDRLSPATSAAFGIFVPGGQMDNFTLDVAIDPSAEQTITFYNASHPGSQLAYHETRLGAMLPVSPDLIFVSSCHNYGATGPDAYRDVLAAFTAKVRAAHPRAGIVLSSQNPQKAPASNKDAHINRLTVIRPFAESVGYGYIPATEAFRAQAGGGASLVDADGIHPTPEGSTLWASRAIAYLDGLSQS